MRGASFLDLAAWALGVAFVAGVVHIASILLLPSLAARDAFARLAAPFPAEGFRLLETPRPGASPFPFADAGALHAVCRFDLARGPYRLSAVVDDETLLVLSFHTRAGVVFQTLSDRTALRGRLDVVLATAAQLDSIEALDVDEGPPREARLAAPTNEGFVFVRAMAANASREDELRARLGAMGCAPQS